MAFKSTATARLTGGTVVRLGLMMSVILFVAAAVMGWIVHDRFQARLLPDVKATSATIGQGVARQIGRAFDNGIPLGGLYGVDTYLSRVLHDNADIDFIALTLPDGSRLHEADGGTASTDALPALKGNSADAVTVEFDRHTDTLVPVFGEGRLVAVVHVGVPRGVFAGKGAARTVPATLAAVIAILLVGWELLRLCVGAWFEFPAASARVVMVDFLRSGPRHRVERFDGSAGALLNAVDRTVKDIDLGYREAAEEAMVAKAGHFDREVIARIDGLIRGLDERFNLTSGVARARSLPDDPAFSRGSSFFLALGLTVAGVAAALPVSFLGWGGSIPLLAAGFSVGVAAGWMIVRRHSRGTFPIGAFLIAAVLLGMGLGDGLERFPTLSGWAGAAIGLGLAAAAARRRFVDGETAASRTIAGGVPTGVLAGALIGALVTTNAGASATFAVAGVGCLAAGIIASRRSRSDADAAPISSTAPTDEGRRRDA